MASGDEGPTPERARDLAGDWFGLNYPWLPTAHIAAATMLSGAALVAVGLAAGNTPARADGTTHSIMSKTGATGQTTAIAQCPAECTSAT